MNSVIQSLKEKVLNQTGLIKEEAMLLSKQPLEELCNAADEIRKAFCKNSFDLCAIINGKNGKCSENCKYCAQSSHFPAQSDSYGLMSAEEITNQAVYYAKKGVRRFSIVTSGRKLDTNDVDKACDCIREIKRNIDISVCISFGLLSKDEFQKAKAAGAERIHNNLESSERYFLEICTTHTYQDKLNAIQDAKKAGLEVCSGGIMGLGETMEDRIDMAMEIRSLGIRSVPVNMLNPIKGTPYENRKRLTEDEMCRIIAVFRFLLPDAFIRLAGGRGLMADKGRKCFQSGANAAITGDMLTTAGITIEQDLQMIKELGYEKTLY